MPPEMTEQEKLIEAMRAALLPFAMMSRNHDDKNEIACSRGCAGDRTIVTSQDWTLAAEALANGVVCPCCKAPMFLAVNREAVSSGPLRWCALCETYFCTQCGWMADGNQPTPIACPSCGVT
jgi:hypothetical protein